MQYSNHLAKQPQGKLLIAVHKATYMSLLFALFESINYNPLDYVTISMPLYRETLIIFSAKESKNQIHGRIYQIIAYS